MEMERSDNALTDRLKKKKKRNIPALATCV